ncbi:hypothetical protein T08_13768 [Trichinella sp. T8]|nr:hypothetical protein T08_13768 [Trichinella sp. T8]
MLCPSSESRNLRSSCQNITGRAVVLPSPWEGSLALQGGSLFGLSILLLLYVFHVPLRACFPFHGTSLRCVFNSYRDDGHRFIAARWEISQCQVTAAFIVENKVPRLRKSIGLQRCHGVLCKISVLWKITYCGVLRAIHYENTFLV